MSLNTNIQIQLELKDHIFSVLERALVGPTNCKTGPPVYSNFHGENMAETLSGFNKLTIRQETNLEFRIFTLKIAQNYLSRQQNATEI